MKPRRRLLPSFIFPAFVVAGVLLSGCETMRKKIKKLKMQMEGIEYEPDYLVSVNRIVPYPRGEESEREIGAFDGRLVCIDRRSFIDSANIKNIEIVPRELKSHPTETPEEYFGGMYDLKLHLDRRGAITWSQMAVGFHQEALAFVINGKLYRVFVPTALADEEKETALVEGPFDDYTAKMLVKHAEDNFEHVNSGGGDDEDE